MGRLFCNGILFIHKDISEILLIREFIVSFWNQHLLFLQFCEQFIIYISNFYYLVKRHFNSYSFELKTKFYLQIPYLRLMKFSPKPLDWLLANGLLSFPQLQLHWAEIIKHDNHLYYILYRIPSNERPLLFRCYQSK